MVVVLTQNLLFSSHSCSFCFVLGLSSEIPLLPLNTYAIVGTSERLFKPSWKAPEAPPWQPPLDYKLQRLLPPR